MSAVRPGVIVETGFESGSTMGTLIQSQDWSQTPIGSAETWPPSLKTALNILLNTPYPMWLVWGRDRLLFYNDAYAAIFGKSQSSLRFGQSILPGTRSDTWKRINSSIEQIFSTGQPLQIDDHWLAIDRSYDVTIPVYNWSCNPLWNEAGQVGGVFATGCQVTQDTAECKRTEESLQQSEERFRFVTQAVNGLIFDWNLRTNKVYRSQKLVDLIGIDAKDAPPEADWWHERIHPDDLARLRPQLTELIASDCHIYDAEYRVRHENGHWVDVWEQACWVRDEAGQVVRVVGCTVNISERKRAEAALRRSEERFRISQELSLDAFTILDSVRNEAGEIVDFVWTYVNPKAAEILKHAADALIGQRLLEVLPGNQLNSELFQRYVQVVETGKSHDIELSYEADGIIGWFRNMAVQLEDGLAIFFSDITDRKQAEAAVRQSEERLRLAMQAAQMGTWDVDLRSGKAIWSEQHFTMLGYEPVETLEASEEMWMSCIHPEDVGRVIEEWQQSREEHRFYRIEYRVVRADNQQISWLAALGSFTYNHRGEAIRSIGVLFDITDRKEAEVERERLLVRERVAREEAETANRIKDEFLAVLSHELRSPLNPILGWSKLLQTRQFDQPASRRALQTIERNAKLQAQLIEDLLDVSRILQGKSVLNVCQTNLVTVVTAALETVHLAAEAKRIQIRTEVSPEHLQILGDPARLQQIVWNLLSNAVKFTPEGGLIQVRLEEAGREAASENHYAQITVSDTGKGINSSFLPYVFDYFRQEDGTTTRKFGGLGLGLAIVRHLTELHGGTVHATSLGEGQGSTFSIRLPLMTTATVSDLEDTLPAPVLDLSQLCILVVDDDEDMRDLLQIVLERQGAEVMLASSAAEALMLFDRQQPDILISDIGMPDVDGYMLVRQIRARSREQGGLVPAIALTAYAGEYNQQQALEAGFQRHVAKPTEPEVLVRAIIELMVNLEGREI